MWLPSLSFKTVSAGQRSEHLTTSLVPLVPEKTEGKQLDLLLLGAQQLFDV